MRVNKWIITCSIVVCIICIVSLFIFEENTLKSNIAVSLLTGAIISAMTAIIYYLNEWQKIMHDIREAIPDIYINLKLIHNLTGEILPQITYVQQLDGLNYRRLLSLASLNMDFVQRCQASAFSCFRKNGKYAHAIDEFLKYSNSLYNLKDCLGKLECVVLDADILQNQLNIKQINNQMISVEENKLLHDKRNLVNIKTAKIHEYEASLLIQLDEIANYYFIKPKNLWEEKKNILNQKAMQIFHEI
jgi:hypothetical protein